MRKRAGQCAMGVLYVIVGGRALVRWVRRDP